MSLIYCTENNILEQRHSKIETHTHTHLPCLLANNQQKPFAKFFSSSGPSTNSASLIAGDHLSSRQVYHNNNRELVAQNSDSAFERQASSRDRTSNSSYTNTGVPSVTSSDTKLAREAVQLNSSPVRTSGFNSERENPVSSAVADLPIAPQQEDSPGATSSDTGLAAAMDLDSDLANSVRKQVKDQLSTNSSFGRELNRRFSAYFGQPVVISGSLEGDSAEIDSSNAMRASQATTKLAPQTSSMVQRNL